MTPEQLARVELMASGESQSWACLSHDDRAALKALLADRDLLLNGPRRHTPNKQAPIEPPKPLAPGYMVIANGKTFDYRELLKRNGFRWSGGGQHWIHDDMPDNEIFRLKRDIGDMDVDVRRVKAEYVLGGDH